MSEWKKVKLGEVTEYITDGDHQPAPKSEQGVYFIKIKDIINNRISFDNALHVPSEYYAKLKNNRKAVKGDVLYTVVGSYGTATYVNTELPFCFERNIALLHANQEINSYFLYLLMSCESFYKKADALANGAAQKLISLKKLQTIEIEIPPLSTQHRIATILSRYDSLIENYQKQIKLLEEAAQRLYKEWFIDLHFPGHENTNIIDGVPEGWEMKKLCVIAEVVMGSSPKSEFYNTDKQGLPFHQGVGSYGVRFVEDNVYSTAITRLAEADSILFSVRAPVGRLNITKNKIIIGRGLAAMNHKQGCQSFLFYMLKERFFKDNIIGNGSIFASISKDDLLNQVFIVPPMKIVKAFESLASKLDKKIQSVDTQLRLLTEARDRLLPKLMSGEIEV